MKALFIFVIAVLIVGLAAGTALAGTLGLLGVGWHKAEVTVLIKPSRGVQQSAVQDVQQAVADWNAALSTVDGAPELVLVNGVKTADIVIRMKVGGGAVLGQALTKTTSPFSCELKSVSIQLSGKAFGQSFSSAGTRNVARHEIGHGLGLGHSDDPNDLMYGQAESSEVFGDDDVGISACDIAGLDAIYPTSGDCDIPASVNCP